MVTRTLSNAMFVALAACVLTLAGCTGTPEPTIEVMLALHDPTDKIAKATLVVDYERSGARPAWVDGVPACSFIHPFITGSFRDDGNGRLQIEARSGRGFRGPVEVAACNMTAESADTAAASVRKLITIRVRDAEDLEGEKVAVRSSDRRPDGAAGLATAGNQSGASKMKRREGTTEGRSKTASGTPPPPTPSDTTAASAQAPSAGGTANQQASQRKAGAGGAAGVLQPAAAPGTAATAQRPTVADAATAKAAASAAARTGGVLDPKQQPGDADEGAAAAPTEPDSPPPYTGDDNDDYDNGSYGGATYDITVSVLNNVGKLSALQFDIDHLGNRGNFVGRYSSTDCAPLVKDVLNASNYPGRGRTAKLALISLNGFRTPGDVAVCGFTTSEPLGAGNFRVVLVDASAAGDVNDDSELPTKPDLAVTSVRAR